MAFPLARNNCYEFDLLTEDDNVEFKTFIKNSETKNLNELVRNKYTETGIGGLIEDRIQNSIELGANIDNIEHDDGNTPLIAAVLNEDIEMVNMLLFHGANVMAENSDGLNVFDIINCLERETGEQFSKRIIELLTDAKNAAN